MLNLWIQHSPFLINAIGILAPKDILISQEYLNFCEAIAKKEKSK